MSLFFFNNKLVVQPIRYISADISETTKYRIGLIRKLKYRIRQNYATSIFTCIFCRDCHYNPEISFQLSFVQTLLKREYTFCPVKYLFYLTQLNTDVIIDETARESPFPVLLNLTKKRSRHVVRLIFLNQNMNILNKLIFETKTFSIFYNSHLPRH